MSKLLKVTLEFDDKIQVLEGEAAEKWLNALNGVCVMEHVHGRPVPFFEWQITPKDVK